jgi:hypothetical protein
MHFVWRLEKKALIFASAFEKHCSKEDCICEERYCGEKIKFVSLQSAKKRRTPFFENIEVRFR